MSRSWSNPKQSNDKVKDDDTQDAHLPPDIDIARVEWSLDQFDLQDQEENLDNISSSDHTRGP